MVVRKKVSESVKDGEDRLMAELDLIAAVFDGIPVGMGAHEVQKRMEQLLVEHEVRREVRLFAMSLLNLFIRSVGAMVKKGR